MKLSLRSATTGKPEIEAIVTSNCYKKDSVACNCRAPIQAIRFEFMDLGGGYISAMWPSPYTWAISNREATKRIHILGQSADGIANGPAWAALTKHRLRMTRPHAEPAFAQGPEQGTAECDEPKQQPRSNVRLLGTWICNDRSACRSEQMTVTSHPAEPLTNGK